MNIILNPIKKKKYHIFYIIKIYDKKKSFLSKKLKFNLFLGFENKKNKKCINIINTDCNTFLKKSYEYIKYNSNINYNFCIEKTNPYILNIKKII